MRRRASAASLGLFVAISLGLCTERAEAGGAVLPGSKVHAVEQRIAVAVAPNRTTVWTSLRFEADAGPVGVVIPVPPGAALDTSSDAWFEALEIATAPRVFAPEGVSATCPGSDDPASDFHITGESDPMPSLDPEEIAILNDAAAVSQWADLNGLDVAPELAAALSKMSGKRFLAARFSAPGSAAVTPALRVVLPGADPTLPLALVRATESDLLVTTWVLGPGLGSFAGATEASPPGSMTLWNAKTGESSYADALKTALSEAGPKASALECAGHDPLVNNVPIADGTAVIDGVITTFFERAAVYGDGSLAANECIVKAAAALASVTPVGASCPRADLGVVDGSDTCVEKAGGYTDPEALRCGAGADDLAVALAGLVPAEVWLTRRSMRIAAGAAGGDWTIEVGSGTPMTPVVDAVGIDLTECSAPDGGTGGSSSGGWENPFEGNTSGGAAPGVPVSNGGGYSRSDMGCTCSGTADTVEWYEADETVVEEEEEYDSYDSGDDCSGGSPETGGDNCSGDTSEPPSDDCSGDGSDTYDSGDDCSGDGSDTYDSGGDDCSSDSSGGGDDCDSGSSGGGDDCDSGSSGGSDWDTGSSSGGDCAIASKGPKAKRRAPRLSAMTLGALALIAPLRRLGTKKRREEKKPTKKK